MGQEVWLDLAEPVVRASPARLSFASRLHGVTDLRPFLEGGWRIVRTLRDKKRRTRGTFHGAASFSPSGQALRYREDGRVKFGGFDGSAFREYHYAFPSSHCAHVCFADGHLFHVLDLTRGHFETTYACGPDTYEGLFTVPAADRWEARWKVCGERKELNIVSCYEKSGSVDGALDISCPERA